MLTLVLLSHSLDFIGFSIIAKKLMDHGADFSIKDIHNNSFWDIATAFGSSISATDLESTFGWKESFSCIERKAQFDFSICSILSGTRSLGRC
jgi:hypothetical protein